MQPNKQTVMESSAEDTSFYSQPNKSKVGVRRGVMDTGPHRKKKMKNIGLKMDMHKLFVIL